MAELSLRDLRSCARFEENCGVHVPEGVEARPANFQCITQRPESLLNNFAGRSVGPAGLVHKEKPPRDDHQSFSVTCPQDYPQSELCFRSLRTSPSESCRTTRFF